MASSLSLKPFLVSTVVSCLSCRVMCRGMHTSVAVDRHWPPKDRRPLSPKRRPTAGKSNWITQTVHYAAVAVGLEGFVCLFTFATGQCLCGAPLSFSFPLKLTIGWFLPLPLFILFFILFLAFLYLHTDRSPSFTFRRALVLPALNL